MCLIRHDRDAGRHYGQLPWAMNSSRDDLHLTTAVRWTTRWNFSWLLDQYPITRRRRCWTRLRSESAAILWCRGIRARYWRHAIRQAGIDLTHGAPTLFDARFADDILNFDDFCPLTSRTRTIDRFIGDTFGANSRFAVRCGEDRGANHSCATTSNSCNRWPAAAYNLGAGGWCCMLAAAGSQSQHLFGISSVKHHFFEGNCMIWLDRSVSLSESSSISMLWFHLSRF